MIYVREILVSTEVGRRSIAGLIMPLESRFVAKFWLKNFDDAIHIVVNDNGVDKELPVSVAYAFKPFGMMTDINQPVNKRSLTFVSWSQDEIDVWNGLTVYNVKEQKENSVELFEAYRRSDKPVVDNAYECENHDDLLLISFPDNYSGEYYLENSFLYVPLNCAIYIQKYHKVRFGLNTIHAMPIIRFASLFDAFTVYEDYLIIAHRSFYHAFTFNSPDAKMKFAKYILINGGRKV